MRSSTAVSLALAAILGLCLAPSALLGIHGVESALALGLVLPFLSCLVGARTAYDRLRLGARTTVSELHAKVTRATLAIWLVPVAILALNALRVRQCAWGEGLTFMVLGPGIGVWLAGLIGMWLAIVLRTRPRAAAALALSWPLFGILLGLFRFWDSPAIFSVGHLYGYFPGTIYDEAVSIPTSFLSFRLGSLALGGGLLAAAAALMEPSTLELRPGHVRVRPGMAALAIGLLAFVAAVEAGGESLGHRSSAQFIADELGSTTEGKRCTVHAPRELSEETLRRIASDCDLRVVQAEQTLGVVQEPKVTAFFFRTVEEKRRYMGAARTYIAKPWRNEVYLQLRGWPHPVLAHEVAHVVAGKTASGPFEVGGQLGGFLPDPALIEGTAVAVAWHDHEELTPHQLAKALIEIDRMPTVDELFGLSFLAQPPRNAYTAAGSFIRYLLDHHGAEAVRKLYRGGDVEEALGQSPQALNDQWRRFLDAVELPPDALEVARVRFSRPSIFSTVCPHALAKLRNELSQYLSAVDDGASVGTCREILSIDPADLWTRTVYVGALARSDNDAGAQRELAKLREVAPQPFVASAGEAIADAAWRSGNRADAQQRYRALLSMPQSVDRARTLEVKLLGLDSGSEQARLVFDLLVGADGRSAGPALAVHVARELSGLREDGLGAYLEGRQLFNNERYDRAAALFGEATMRGLATPRLQQETQRLQAIALFAAGDLAKAERVLRSIRSDPRSSAARRNVATDWLQRIVYVKGGAP